MTTHNYNDSATVPLTENWKFRVGDILYYPDIPVGTNDTFAIRNLQDGDVFQINCYDSGTYSTTEEEAVMSFAYSVLSELAKVLFTKVFETRFSISKTSNEEDYNVRVYKVSDFSAEGIPPHYTVVWGPNPNAYSPPDTYNTTFAKFSNKENLLHELYNINTSESLSEVAELQYTAPEAVKVLNNIGDYVSSGITLREQESLNATISHPANVYDLKDALAKLNFDRRISHRTEDYGSIENIPNEDVLKDMGDYNQPAPEGHPLSETSENESTFESGEPNFGGDEREDSVYQGVDFYWKW